MLDRWQRPDITTRTSVKQAYARHNPAAEAVRLASEWAAITTSGGLVSTGQYDPDKLARMTQYVADAFADGDGVQLGDSVLLPEVPPVEQPHQVIWTAALRSALGMSSMLVSDKGKRADVRPLAGSGMGPPSAMCGVWRRLRSRGGNIGLQARRSYERFCRGR